MLVSGVFDFRHRGIEPIPSISGPLDFELSVLGNPLEARPYFFDPGIQNWVELTDFSVTSTSVIARTQRVGIFAAFAVPEPGSFSLLIAVAALAAHRGRVRIPSAGTASDKGIES